MLDTFCIVKDMGRRASEQEQMGELGADSGDDLVVRRWNEACDLVEGEDQDLEGGDNGE